MRIPQLPKILCPFLKGNRYLQPLMDMGQESLNFLFVAILCSFFLVNDTFFLSVFMSARNSVSPERQHMLQLTDIHLLGIDDEALEVSGAFGLHSYEVLAESLSLISGYAKANPEKRVVAGFDFILDDGSYLADDRSPEARGISLLTDAIETSSDNLFIVMGASLDATGGAYRLANINGACSYIRDRLSDQAARRFSVGYVNYLTSSMKSGFDTVDIARIALGYVPFIMGEDNFASFPLLLSIAGKVPLQGSGPLEQDFGMGNVYLREVPGEPAAFPWKQGGRLFRYNFFLKEDVRYHSSHMTLSNFSERLSYLGMDNSSLFSQKIAQSATGNVQYFLVYQMPAPGYYRADDDLIFPVNPKRDPYTGEYLPVPGVTAHATALANLIHSSYILDAPFMLDATLMLLSIVGAILAAGRKSALRCFGALITVFALIFAIGFLAFLFHILVHLKWIALVSILVFLPLFYARATISGEGAPQ